MPSANRDGTGNRPTLYMMRGHKMKKTFFLLMTLFIMHMFTNEIYAQGLDATIREASSYLNERIPFKSKVVILNVESTSDALSDYIIEELVANAVNDGNFTVVDRKQLADIQAELNFQLSGEVADNQAVAIGQKFGAQTIVSGRVSPMGENYRISVRALSVESATIQAQFNKNIPADPTISALMKVPNTPRTTVPTNTTTTTRPTTSTPPTTVITPPPPTKEYKICDIGPAGGYIFYDKGSYSNGWRYLEAAPASSEYKAEFGLYNKLGSGMVNNIICSGTNTGIGSGKANTATIIRLLNANEETSRAAQICEALSINGYSDWFLPSKDELQLMFQNLHENGYGKFLSKEYMSSSLEYPNGSFYRYQPDAFYEQYKMYPWGDRTKATFTIRAIRAF